MREAVEQSRAGHQIVVRPMAKRWLSLALAAATVGAVAGWFAPVRAQQIGTAGAEGYVYTADEKGHTVSEIDLASGHVTTVPVAVAPHNIQAVASSAMLLVVGDSTDHGSAHGRQAKAASPSGRLLLLDARSLAAGPIASISVGEHPAHVVAERDGRRAFVTLAGADHVSVVDLTERKIVKTIKTGRYPHGLRLSPDGRRAYVANVLAGSVSVIDLQSLSELARIPVGKAPVQVAFTPDGREAYVSLRDENRVAVIDTGAQKVVARIAVGRNPIQTYATPDGRFVLVANQGADASPDNRVSIIDVAARRVVNTLISGAGAHGVVVNDDGRRAYVTNTVDSTLTAIAIDEGRAVGHFRVGDGPNGVTFVSATDRSR